jgi:hypothetical protein
MNIKEFLYLLQMSLQVIKNNFFLLTILTFQVFGLGSLSYLWLSKSRIIARASFDLVLSIGVSISIIGSCLLVWISKYLPRGMPILEIEFLLYSLMFIAFFISVRRFSFPKRKISPEIIAIVIAVSLIAILRLAFIYELEFPLYYDSSVHYQIVKDLLMPYQFPKAFYNLEKIFSFHYYHFGFHSIVASNLGVSSKNVSQGILIIGQLFLVISPFSLALFVKRLTLSTWAGIYTALFAGIGWDMPAYAINWGKYPAVAAVAIIPLTITWLAFFLASKKKNRKRFFLVLFFLTLISTALLHTRAIIIIICVLGSILLVKHMQKIFSRDKENLYIAILIEFIALITLFNTNHNFYDAVIPYFHGINFIISLFAVLLTFFSIVRYGEFVFSILAFTLLVWIISFQNVPTPLIKYFGEYFLDRPFVQTFMFAPLAITSGIGIQNLTRSIVSNLNWKITNLSSHLSLFIFVLLAIFLLFSRPVTDYRPDPCCILIKEDDLFTIGWMGQNLPQGSQVLIASQYKTNQNIAIDGGAWIYPLASIKTVPALYSTDFKLKDIHAWLCNSRISNIYLGSTSEGFDVTGLEGRPLWYKIVISFPETRVYQINCQNQ